MGYCTLVRVAPVCSPKLSLTPPRFCWLAIVRLQGSTAETLNDFEPVLLTVLILPFESVTFERNANPPTPIPQAPMAGHGFFQFHGCAPGHQYCHTGAGTFTLSAQAEEAKTAQSPLYPPLVQLLIVQLLTAHYDVKSVAPMHCVLVQFNPAHLVTLQNPQ